MSQITSLTIVYSTVYSGADQRKHQSPASLAFVPVIHRWPVNSPHKWPVTRKMFPFDDVIMLTTSAPSAILYNVFENHTFKIIDTAPRGHWVKNLARNKTEKHTCELYPMKVIMMKKSTAQSWGKGICAKPSGYTTNTRPGPMEKRSPFLCVNLLHWRMVSLIMRIDCLFHPQPRKWHIVTFSWYRDAFFKYIYIYI